MKTKRRQDKNLLLKKEIEVKDLLILQLMKTITENNIKVFRHIMILIDIGILERRQR